MNNEVLDCIRRIGTDLIALADAFLLAEPAPKTRTRASSKKETVTDVAAPEKEATASGTVAPEKEATASEKKELTYDFLREYLGNLAEAGHSEEVLSLLKKYGANKLSKVAEEQYGALYTEAKEICHA